LTNYLLFEQKQKWLAFDYRLVEEAATATATATASGDLNEIS